MAGNTTGQRAVEAALVLFSQKGLTGVSMGDIAGALGIKAPSLYKYFKGKEELCDQALGLLRTQADQRQAALARQLDRLERDLQALGLLSAERLEQETLAWVEPALNDANARTYRRILTLEQFTSTEAARECRARLYEDYVHLHAQLFDRLIGHGVLRRGDSQVMAQQFVAPIAQIIAACDAQDDSRDLRLEELRRHIRHFHRVYAVRERQPQPSPTPRFFRR